MEADHWSDCKQSHVTLFDGDFFPTESWHTFSTTTAMLARRVLELNFSRRSFSLFTRRLQDNKFLLPKEFEEKEALKRAQDELFKQSLLNKDFDVKPKIKPPASSPPLNVELLQYKPLRLPPTHGHQVAKLKFRGYNADHLTRASEFAARAAFYLGIPCSRPKKMKTERRLYTVIKSPFAQAKTKENFLRITYNQELKAYDANPEVIDLWLSYINKNSVEDVKCLAEITTRESLDFATTLDEMTASDMKFPEAYEDTSDPIAAKVRDLLQSKQFKQHF